MRLKSILVHVEPGSTSSDARLDLAVALAMRHGATLIGAAAEAVRPPPVDAFGGALLVDEMLTAEDKQVREDIEAAERRFRSHPGLGGLRTEWRSAVAVPADFLVREARAADLLVLGRDLERLSEGVYRSADPGEVLMSAGRPVLVVPPGSAAVAAQRVLVAWKETRESRRAVADALPLLRGAEAVHVVQVVPEADFAAATARVGDVVGFLERHEIRAQGEVRTRREKSVADELILVAEQRGADLIVAGAYGHTRLREMVFGGVTRDLVNRSPKCCLLSH